jgi:Tol biopolymer transport system component
MGEVYKAIDTRLDRQVAIKVLPLHVATDPDAKARFDREAKAISSLSHPHICTLYDVGQQDGVDFIVMEYLEGQTLAERLERGPLPLAQALHVGVQIADALDKAHRQGVVHRDLKPGNVMLTSAGAKLLDFGLAKLRAPGGAAVSGAPTVSSPLTGAGTVVGTYQYMAPEQLEGRDTDARTDIFAFGSLLYEMLTGRRAFEGTSQASVIAAILKDTSPSIAALQPLCPPMLDGIVATCLAKSPDDRWQSAGDVGRQLKLVQTSGLSGFSARPLTSQVSGVSMTPASPSTRGAVRQWQLMFAAALAALVIAAGAAVWHWPSQPVAEPVRFTINAPANLTGGQLAISPDGRHIAFVAGTSPQEATLFVRTLDNSEPRPVQGSEGAISPFWSADSRHIGFAARGQLKRVAVDGGVPQAITEIGPTFSGGSWNAAGDILFSEGPNSPIRLVTASGGDPKEVAKLPPGGIATALPWFLPDGRAFLFTSIRSLAPGDSDIHLGSLDGDDSIMLVQGATRPMYAPPGYVLFDRAGELMAQRFDASARALREQPVRVVTNLASIGPAPLTIGAVAVSASGVLAYAEGTGANSSAASLSRLTWRDRQGNMLGTIGDPGPYGDVALSPDGRKAAVHVHEGRSGGGIWILDIERQSLSQFTFDRSHNIAAVWSPDSRTIVYTSILSRLSMFRKAASGAGPEEPVLESNESQKAETWSKKGVILFTSGTTPVWDIWRLTLDGAASAAPLLATKENELLPSFSPDGQWFSYSLLESGGTDVYVRAYPDLKGPWRVSTGGGNLSRWSANGRELFYLWNDAIWTAPIDTSGETPVIEPPRELFKTRLRLETPGGYPYDISSDGRFLLNEIVALASPGAAVSRIAVVLNWQASLNR